ncbi:MAG: LamG domain-containing protein [Planctomycetota bacterium]|nr:MAG: LamG domain-containing protein [Planctomycetota bacterium]
MLGKKLIIFGGVTLILATRPMGCLAGGKEPAAWWGFDEGKKDAVLDGASGRRAKIEGNFKYVRGVRGKAIKFDGFTSRIVRKASEGPELDDSFTIEAWLALGAYPWNWSPIVSQAEHDEKGYYFGIDSQGRFGLGVKVGEEWVECKSEIREELKGKVGEKVDLDLRRWYHVAGVYESGEGMRIYKDGKEVGRVSAAAKVRFARELDILIGRNRRPMAPTHPVRTWATYPSWYSFDGIMDEVKIYGRALSGEEITKAYKSVRPRHKPEFASRAFPTAPERGRFGAFYTRLKYYDEWDALWRVGDEPDMVVEFDELPINVMFWRGSRYSPCWVTENGKWMADQSRETGENWDVPRPREEVPTGCCEHMSDAQCRFSHVRLIESSDARVVIHWRYALIDVLYRQSGVDPTTGWGYWGDEYYTIYPDGVGTRNLVPGTGGWQETIFFSAPGTRPEDNCELEAITLVNLKGESRSYSWEHGYPEFDLEKALIQMTNLKAKYRPFMIFRPGSDMEVFNVEVRPEYSHFPWWNHWPVAQVISDGRHAQAADRMAHSSLAWGGPRDNVAIYGMTDKPAVSLVSLAKSWIYPAELKVRGSNFVSEGYNYRERAYIVNRKKGGSNLECELVASAESPLVNPAFVIKNWGKADAILKVDGNKIKRGRKFRLGHRHGLEGSDLIVWVRYESGSDTEFAFEAKR